MNPAHTPLVEAARSGDAQALHELLRRCQPDLRRFARRSCASSEDAEDAVQLALWTLHRRIGTLRTVATFTTWLFRIVERECFRLLRRQPRHQPLDELAAHEHPEAAAVPLDLRQDLVRALQALSPPYREVLLLRDVHELSGPEVAAELGLSLEAVKSRLHRARAQVRQRLLASGYWLKDGVPQPEVAGRHTR
ncbi:RNA polymerase sigma factor [Roseateles sp. DB2]|uniref:RNA polymerase sigma factor n=1 Tax=Roseateles sp. DB2 TaxID=3453717 RepID=UPI003EECBDA3